MVILGIDPGLATLGYGVIDTKNDKHRLIQYGVLTTTPQQTLPERLIGLYKGLTTLMQAYQPEQVAFEELFFSKNITTGIAVASARGVALLAARQHTAELYEYTPMQIKQAVTGYGKAEKHQVQMMVKMLLGMDEIARPDDAADAVACALTHALNLRAREMFRIH